MIVDFKQGGTRGNTMIKDDQDRRGFSTQPSLSKQCFRSSKNGGASWTADYAGKSAPAAGARKSHSSESLRLALPQIISVEWE